MLSGELSRKLADKKTSIEHLEEFRNIFFDKVVVRNKMKPTYQLRFPSGESSIFINTRENSRQT